MPQPTGYPHTLIVTVTDCVRAGVFTLPWNDAEGRYQSDAAHYVLADVPEPTVFSLFFHDDANELENVFILEGQGFTSIAEQHALGEYEGAVIASFVGMFGTPAPPSRMSLGLGLGL